MSQIKTSITKLLYLFVCIAMIGTMIPPAGVLAYSPPIDTPDSSATNVTSDQDSKTYLVYIPLIMKAYIPPVSIIVEPAAGGELGTADGVTVSFASNAVEEPIEVIHHPLPTIRAPHDKQVVGEPFALTATRLSDGAEVTGFAPEVELITYSSPFGAGMQTRYEVTNTVYITINYNDADVIDVDEHSLRLHYRAGHKWVPMLTLVDVTYNRAVAPTDHFSEFALLASSLLSTTTPTHHIVLDPDHGGTDPGGTVVDPTSYAIEEKDVNLQVADLVRDRLEGCGVQVELTREDDSAHNGAERVAFINAQEPDLAMTIAFNIWQHTMSTFDGGALGLVDMTQPEDVTLAQLSVDAVGARTGLSTDRGVEDANTWAGGLYVPLNISAPITYAQAELAFLDSYTDRAVIDEHPELFAAAVIDAITQTLGITSCPMVMPDESRLPRTWGLSHGTKFAAQGVNPATGSQFQWFRDLFVPGVGLNVDIVRYYNSQDEEIGIFGRGWSSPFDMRLLFEGDAVNVKYGDGQRGAFAQDDGAWVGEPGIYDTLEQDGAEWVLTTPQQVAYRFNTDGRLQSITDRRGSVLTLNYSGRNPTEIVDTVGRVFTLEYNANNCVTRITDPQGREVTYDYGTTLAARRMRRLQGIGLMADDVNLLGMTDARGGTTNYDYDPSGNWMTSVSDPEGITYLQNAYDSEGRVAVQNDPYGRGEFDYDIANLKATFTDAEGHQTIFYFDQKYRVIKEEDALGNSKTYEYDDSDNMTAMTDKRGNTWYYTYDDRGNMLTREDPVDYLSQPLYASDITTWTYNDDNTVASETDALGYTTSYEYDEDGNPTHITEANGAETHAEYDDKGNLVRLTDAEGRETRFEYDEHGNRIKTIDAEGNVTTSTYDDDGHELSRTDANGHTTRWEYDGNGNVTKEIDASGHETTFEYDGNNMMTKQRDRRSGVTSFKYNDNLDLLEQTDPEGHTIKYEYDKMSNRTKITDAKDNVTTFEYDDVYNLLKVTNPKGDVTTYTHDENGNLLTMTDALGGRTRFMYDAVNRKRYVYDAIGGMTEYCYDQLDRIVRLFDPRRAETRFYYDAVSNLEKITDPLGYNTLLEYDRVHNRTAVTDGNGHRTEFVYDEVNREIARTNPLGDVMRTGYDGVGNTTVITDALGYVTRMEYDDVNNLTRVINALGYTIGYEYDAEGNRISITNQNGHTSNFEYDLNGLTIKITDPLGNESTFDYDANRNLIYKREACACAGGAREMRYDYDELNLLIEEIDPLDLTTSYEYDALRRLTTKIDAAGKRTEYGYNAMGWLTNVTDALGQVTRYDYDEVSNRTVITDANGITTTFEYNHLNQLIMEINPLEKTWRYAYDGVGNMTRRVDGKWQATYYRYDAADRLIETEYGLGGQQVTFEYDANGNEIAMIDWNGRFEYTYDELNRRTTATDYNGRTLRYRYDPAGNRLGLTYPDDREVTYEYDDNDRVLTMTDPESRVTAYDYDPLGFITGQTNPNGTSVEYEYDAAGRLTALRNARGGAVFAGYDFVMDDVGNRTQVTENRHGAVVVHDYQYDDLYRLIQARTDTGQNMQYVYDAVGNRQRKQGAPEPTSSEPMPPAVDVTYDYNELHGMTRAGDARMDYDDNGNRVHTTRPLSETKYTALGITGTLEISYTYDYDNRMTAVQEYVSSTAGISLTLEAEYTYDGYGRRLRKEVQTYITATNALSAPHIFRREYVYDGLSPVAEYETEDTTPLAPIEIYYYYANGRMVSMERDSAAYWYHYDGLGSVVALTDESGAEVTEYRFDEYGNLIQGDAGLNHYLYTGQELDEETGLVHFFARYYDAENGVWVTRDLYRGEAASPLSLHLYAYVLNNPVSSVDMFGWKDYFVRGFKPPGSKDDEGGIYDIFDELCADKGGKIYGGTCKTDGKMIARYYDDACEGASCFGNAPSHEIVEEIINDIVETKKKNPNEPIHLVGHSTGGAAILDVSRELYEKDSSIKITGLYALDPNRPGNVARQHIINFGVAGIPGNLSGIGTTLQNLFEKQSVPNNVERLVTVRQKTDWQVQGWSVNGSEEYVVDADHGGVITHKQTKNILETDLGYSDENITGDRSLLESTAVGTFKGAVIGAAVGSLVPGIGTGTGALIGGLVGGIGGAFKLW